MMFESYACAVRGFSGLPLEELDELSREMDGMTEREKYELFHGRDENFLYLDN